MTAFPENWIRMIKIGRSMRRNGVRGPIAHQFVYRWGHGDIEAMFFFRHWPSRRTPANENHPQ